MKLSWNQKYSYTFTWMGRPVIQHPEDMIRFQEIVCDVRPDIIVETGVAHGGSLVYCASLMKAMGKGRQVIGVDIEIRPHNRKAIEEHCMWPMITLIEGSSTAPEIVEQVRALIRPDDCVLVVLDSDHSYAHVANELENYAPFITSGSYIVATDGIMREVADTPLGKKDWIDDNPANAAEAFAATHPEFILGHPAWQFNESGLEHEITGWPSAYLRRT